MRRSELQRGQRQKRLPKLQLLACLVFLVFRDHLYLLLFALRGWLLERLWLLLLDVDYQVELLPLWLVDLPLHRVRLVRHLVDKLYFLNLNIFMLEEDNILGFFSLINLVPFNTFWKA